MRRRPSRTTLLIVAVWGIGGPLALLTVALILMAIGQGDISPTTILAPLSGVLSVLTGAILVTRLPANRIGWLLWIGGGLIVMIRVTQGLADLGLTSNPGSIPGAIWIGWVNAWIGLPAVVTLPIFLPLLFPTGRVPSPRWRSVVGAAVGAIVVAAGVVAVSPFPAGTYPPDIVNPLAIGGSAGDALVSLGNLVDFVLFVVLLLAAWSLVIRYRRAQGVEREQLKWFAFFGIIAVASFIFAAANVSNATGPLATIDTIAWTTGFVALAMIPVAIGIAILRYRLYEIDRLISRTISWAVVSLLVVGIFAGCVLALQALLASVLRSNELAVAGSTLLVFALFQPIRRRVQRLVDRRFNRARYDAEATVSAFAGRLRDEVDLQQSAGRDPGHGQPHRRAQQRLAVVPPMMVDARRTADGFGARADPSAPLGMAGRIIVVASVAVALAIGLSSGTGLFEATPYGLVGGFLAIRRPGNPIGWLLLAGAWSFAVSSINVPVTAAQLTSGTVPAAALALAVIQAASWGPLLVVLLVITIVFPTGRLPLGRWGQLARLAVATVVVLAILSVFAPTISVTVAGVSSGVTAANPLAVAPAWSGWIVASQAAPITLMLTAVAVGAMFVRLRGAQGVERAQLRWLVWSLAFIVIGFVVGLVGDATLDNGLNGLVWVPAIVAFALPPIAIGIAILRYRLYEIDRLISRTISWAAVTLILGACFVLVILVAQALIAPVTGSSELAVAGSTLLVAALFQPIRRRVQRLVDRRFNRARYDAEATINAFAGRLRDEVDLEHLRVEILATVGHTVEPSSVSLWLRA